MTNWLIKEQVTFQCPDCGHIQHEMTRECPVCHNVRIASRQPGYSLHRISFGMNGGQRKENYQIFLTEDQVTAFSALPDLEAYNSLWMLWDQVVDASVDAGTDYEGMGCEIIRDWEQRKKCGSLA
ncbi:MAG: hypothetical protein Q8N94_05545 [Methanoregula sp.]|nr:hypothetical protein [Methanoregula sp.]